MKAGTVLIQRKVLAGIVLKLRTNKDTEDSGQRFVHFSAIRHLIPTRQKFGQLCRIMIKNKKYSVAEPGESTLFENWSRRAEANFFLY